MAKNIKIQKRIRRHKKIRSILSGTKDIPRLSVFRSNKFIYAQLIDDESRKTVISESSMGIKNKKLESAFEVGKKIAEKAKDLKIKAVVFDRGGFSYKGRVKAVADGAREGGLKF